MIKCPDCGVRYKVEKTDFEYQGIVVRGIKCLRCPRCGDELFTPEQYDAIRARVMAIAPPLRLTRKISRAGGRPTLYLPEDLVKVAGLKVGDEVDIYLEGKRKIVVEPSEE